MIEKSAVVAEELSLASPGSGPLKVLLVDDKEENLIALEALLENNEFEVEFIKTTSGNEALNIALKEELALILLDVQMPGMDGYEVARFLKQNSKTRAVPLLFVTALDQDVNYILEGYEKGAVDYLFKPLNPAITRAKVKAFIKTYLQQKELEHKNFLLQNLAMLVNNSLDAMCILEVDSLNILKVNPSWTQLFGLREEVIGSTLDDLPGFEGSFQAIKDAEGSVAVFENSLPSDTGKNKWFSWSFVKKNNFWYGNGKDITKNKRIEEELEASNEVLEERVKERTTELLQLNAKLQEEVKKRSHAEKELKQLNERLMRNNEELDSFVYTASHDLKAPIANLETLFVVFEKKLKDKLPPSDSKLFDMIGQSLGKFRTTLSDLSKVTTLQQDLQDEYTRIDLQEIYESVVEDIKTPIEESRASITVNLEVKEIFYAKKHIRSIFYNLLSNAIKYKSADRDPAIAVRSYTSDEFVVLSVKDNGMGLSASQKKRMFSLFQRFHKQIEGSGVGLYMLKKIISNNGGNITLESTEGEGTEFKVFLKKVERETD